MARQGSKSGKSSKTARVLNLLTDPGSVEAPSAREADAAESAKLADDRRTQARIRGALEMEFAEAAPVRPSRSHYAAPVVPDTEMRIVKELPLSEMAPPPAKRIIKEADPLPEFTADDDPDQMPEPAFSIPTAAPSTMELALNELRSVGEAHPDEYICYNVTQTLVEDKADKYIRMFGLCSCSRCRIDVIALALSNLPPKYVVAKPHELIPRLSIYEQKYNAAVVTQVMSACRRVLERPHHAREK